MQGRIFVGLFLCCLFAIGGDAQSAGITEKPVWTLEFIKVRPENLCPALDYLNDHWMRVRAEAKHQGAVLDYHLISNGGLVTPSHGLWEKDSIVLLTKYKSVDAYLESQKVFPLMREHLPTTEPGFIFRQFSLDDLFEAMNSQVFVEEPETTTGLKLLTKR